MNRGSNTEDRTTDVEEKVKLAQLKTEELEKELLQAKDIAHMHEGCKLEQVCLIQDKLAKGKREIEDAVKAQERVKALEIESRQLKCELIDSQFKIAQLEQSAIVAVKKLDVLTMNIRAWREKESLLQEQLAAAEFRAKIAEEKFDMQTELLQKEIKMRVMTDDELINGKATSNKQEIDFIQLTEKLQDLESQFKSSNNKLEDHEKQSMLNKENSGKEIEKTTNFNTLSEISEARAKQVQHIITSLQEDLQGFSGMVSSKDQKEDAVKQTEMNMFMPDELNQSQEQKSVLEQNLKSEENLLDAREKLSSVEIQLQSAALRKIELQAKLGVYEEHLTVQESIINKTTMRCMELEKLLEAQAKDTQTKFVEAKEAFMCAVTAAERLHEKLEPLERQGKQSENQAQASTSAASGQMKGLARTRDIAKSVFLPFQCNRKRISEDENVFADDARISSRANCIQPSNFSLTFVLGVVLLSVLLGFIIEKHYSLSSDRRMS